MTILDAAIVLHSPAIILASSIPKTLSNLNWGDMEDFIKFMRMYESSSQMVTPLDRLSDLPKIIDQTLQNSMLLVSNENTSMMI